MLDPATLPSTDVNIIQTICQNDIIKQVYQLAQQFRTIIQERMASALDAWLALCEASQVSSLHTFAAGIRQDYAAIRAALETEWSNGQTEGQVNRLKLLKRQMYGRAKFDLLRLRVLHPT
jgi:transposase